MTRFFGNRARTLAAAGILTVGGIAGTGIAVVNAQQPSPTPPVSLRQRPAVVDDYVNRLAQNLGISPDKLREALKQTALQEVDAALANGTITAQQAQAARDRINAGELGPLGFGLGRGGGMHGPRIAAGADLAQFLGITPKQLHDELNGKSLAQVAQAHGKSRDQLVAYILSGAEQRLNDAVATGRTTRQQVDQRLSDLKSHIDELVDRVHQQGQGRGPQGGTGNGR